MLGTVIKLQKPNIPSSFNMNSVISKCVKFVILSNFSGNYLRNCSTLDIDVLDYICVL